MFINADYIMLSLVKFPIAAFVHLAHLFKDLHLIYAFNPTIIMFRLGTATQFACGKIFKTVILHYIIIVTSLYYTDMTHTHFH